MDLRCVMVHDFICSFTIYFQQLLQGTMGRRCRLITNICKLFGDRLRTVGGHLTIITSTPSVEQRGVRGGLSNYKWTLNVRPCVLFFWTWGGQTINNYKPLDFPHSHECNDYGLDHNRKRRPFWCQETSPGACLRMMDKVFRAFSWPVITSPESELLLPSGKQTQLLKMAIYS